MSEQPAERVEMPAASCEPMPVPRARFVTASDVLAAFATAPSIDADRFWRDLDAVVADVRDARIDEA